ncbi:MAG: hypothetical protein KDD89_10510 [Anaerolineales bacterium]|nr:hypothetical protein [Anaerolineales bacterium]
MQNKAIYMSLAPTDLEIYRTFRYDGGGFEISLKDLAVEDVTLLAQVYNLLKSVYDLWLYMGDQPNYNLMRERLKAFAEPEFLTKVQTIGSATYSHGINDERMHNAIHDIRGGALTSLTGYARLLPRLPDNENYIRQAVYLARDHAKMLRNILPDLDTPVREADEGTKLHAMDEFIHKWDGFTFELPGKSVTVNASSTYTGYITSRCLETSAMDRILYNYINNAARFASDSQIKLTVIPVGRELTRWIVENNITDDQVAWLRQEVDDLKELFHGGHTRGGTGRGLLNCANFVSTSFGINSDEAIDQEYLGAKVFENTYYAWFHWPIYVRQSADEPECDCGEH